MKNKIKDLLVLFLIFLGAILFDITNYKLTGVIIIIMAFALDAYDEED